MFPNLTAKNRPKLPRSSLISFKFAVNCSRTSWQALNSEYSRESFLSAARISSEQNFSGGGGLCVSIRTFGKSVDILHVKMSN